MQFEQVPKHAASSHGGSSALELFRLPPTDTSIMSARWQSYYPEARIQRGSPIEFNIETTLDYIDLSKCYMTFVFKIVKANGGNLADKKVIPVNNFLHTMIKQMSIKLNNTLVTEQNDTYAYKAYLKGLLGYPKDGTESYLTRGLWYLDLPPFNATNVADVGGAADTNTGAVAREAFVHGSKVCQVQGTPAHALFQTDRYLVGDININIRIDINNEAFCFMSEAGTELLQITHAECLVRYVKISDSVRLRHIAIMSGAGGAPPQPALYPLERGDVQAYNIAAGQSRFQRNDLSKIPRRVLMGLVTTAAYAGISNQNPFNFTLSDLKTPKLLVNGEEYPAAGIELDQNGHVNGYNSLMLGGGNMHRGLGLQFERRLWANGFALFMWDLTPDGSADHLHPEYRGQVTLKGFFSAPTTAVLILIVYREFVDIMEIDANKNVTYNMS